jgi:hypothetical protein
VVSENKQKRRYKQTDFTGPKNNRHSSQHTFGNVHKAVHAISNLPAFHNCFTLRDLLQQDLA